MITVLGGAAAMINYSIMTKSTICLKISPGYFRTLAMRYEFVLLDQKYVMTSETAVGCAILHIIQSRCL